MRIKIKPGALHEHCKAEGISRDELSRRLGVSTVTAYRIDAGKVDPSPRFMAALMTVTGTKFEDLFEIIGEDAA